MQRLGLARTDINRIEVHITLLRLLDIFLINKLLFFCLRNHMGMIFGVIWFIVLFIYLRFLIIWRL